MQNVLVSHWWAVALRGLFAIIFGFLALFMPSITLEGLILLFGAYSLADGITAIVAAFRQRRHWGTLVWHGVFSLAMGVVALVWPAITALALLFIIAGWAIVTGMLQLIAAARLRREIDGELLLALSGIASLAFGILALVSPGAGALTVVWLIGAYAMIAGGLQLVLGLRLRAISSPRRPRHIIGAPSEVGA